MNAHLVVFLAEENDMIGKDYGHHAVELQNCVDATEKETLERIVLFEIIHDNLVTCHADVVVFQHLCEVIQVQVLSLGVRLCELAVYFLDDFVCYHLSRC